MPLNSAHTNENIILIANELCCVTVYENHSLYDGLHRLFTIICT